MYASFACTEDSTAQHHKSEKGNKNRNFLVRWFYKYYWFFGYLCFGAEFTYILLLVHECLQETKDTTSGTSTSSVSSFWQSCIQWGLIVCVPGCAAKQVVNVAQLSSSCYAIAAYDAVQKNGRSHETKKA
jgi:hypothetical protein